MSKNIVLTIDTSRGFNFLGFPHQISEEEYNLRKKIEKELVDEWDKGIIETYIKPKGITEK